MTVGQTIRALRKKRGLTQADLGDLCGLSAAAICAYERGRSQPKRQILEKLAAALNVPVSALITETAPESSGTVGYEEILGALKLLHGAVDEVVLLNGCGNQSRYFALGQDRQILREGDMAVLAQTARAALLSAAERMEPRQKLG